MANFGFRAVALHSLLSVTSIVGVGVCLAAFGAGCSKAKTDEITVGSFLSLSGADSAFGTDTRRGIELAMEEVNAAGGVKGKKVHVVYEDDKSTPLEATNKVQQLIDRDKAIAILGEVASSRTIAGGIIANTKKVPLITPSSTAVEVTQGKEYVFRVCFTDDQQGDVAARFVHDTLKKNNVGILFVAQDNYSSGLAQSFKTSFEKLGGKIVVEKGYQARETNFTTYLEGMKAANPEIIFAPVYYNDMVQIARQAKGVGIPGTNFVGGDGWDANELLDGAGADLEGAYFTNHYAPDVPWPNSQAFLKSFHDKYHSEPTSMCAQGYDAARLLVDAMGRATELTPEAVKNAIATTKDFQGATGKVTIDANHNARKTIVVVQIKNKQFHYSSEVESQ